MRWDASEESRGKRGLALQAFNAAVQACDPGRLVEAAVAYGRGGLKANGKAFKARRIYVAGAGKASGAMASAIERIVPVKEGVVAVPEGTAAKHKTGNIRLMESTHPYPSEKSAAAARQMLALAKKAGKGDLIICLVSGGGSSLMEAPIEGISMDESAEVSRLLMHAGAGIRELNCVRQGLSRVKGGRLASAFCGATVLNLVVSDVVGSPLDVIASGPTVKCDTSPAEARKIFAKYRLTGKPAVERALAAMGKAPACGKMPKIDSIVLADNGYAVDAAARYLIRQGLKPLVIKNVAGEARQVGRNLAKLVNDGQCFVAGGETTVTVKGKGKGGRSQELALSAALRLKRGVLLAAGTDGIDGCSDAAGAVVDSQTATLARKKGMAPERYLKNNDSNTFFRRLGGSLVKTGPTGTNVCDLIIGIP